MPPPQIVSSLSPRPRRKKLFRSRGYGWAVGEGVVLFLLLEVAGGLLFRTRALSDWEGALRPLLFLLALGTALWSTRRLARLRPRWRAALLLGLLGPLLAILDSGVDALWQIFQKGPVGVSVEKSASFFLLHALFFTIVVILTHLGQQGFLRFTMPKGEGRVTL